jgi:hypothetical protein
MSDLADLRRGFIDGSVPILVEASEAAVVLDISERAVWERYDNAIVARGSRPADLDRHLVRSSQVKLALLAMKRPFQTAKPAPAKVCLSCGDPLPAGARRSTRFCSKRCSGMTPSARASLREKRALENPAFSLALDAPHSAKAGVVMAGTTWGALPATPFDAPTASIPA